MASLEDTIDVGSRSIELATNTIKDVLAIVSGISTSGVTALQTEDTGAHEVVPFDDLLEGLVIAVVGRESVREKKTTKRVTTLISSVRVHLHVVR